MGRLGYRLENVGANAVSVVSKRGTGIADWLRFRNPEEDPFLGSFLRICVVQGKCPFIYVDDWQNKTDDEIMEYVETEIAIRRITGT